MCLPSESQNQAIDLMQEMLTIDRQKVVKEKLLDLRMIITPYKELYQTFEGLFLKY